MLPFPLPVTITAYCYTLLPVTLCYCAAVVAFALLLRCFLLRVAIYFHYLLPHVRIGNVSRCRVILHSSICDHPLRGPPMPQRCFLFFRLLCRWRSFRILHMLICLVFYHFQITFSTRFSMTNSTIFGVNLWIEFWNIKKQQFYIYMLNCCFSCYIL